LKTLNYGSIELQEINGSQHEYWDTVPDTKKSAQVGSSTPQFNEAKRGVLRTAGTTVDEWYKLNALKQKILKHTI